MFYKLSLIMSSPILSGPWLNMGLIREKENFQARHKSSPFLWNFQKLSKPCILILLGSEVNFNPSVI